MAAQIPPAPGHAGEAVPRPQPILTTSRLIIRPIYKPDAESMSLAGNNPKVSKYMSLTFPHPYTIDSALHWIGMNQGPQLNHFGICERASPDVIIGGIGLKPGSDIEAGSAEVGFWIGESFWGMGFTTEALEAFTDWSFREWSKDGVRLRRVWGNHLDGNTGSGICFLKCGFQKEGVMRGQAEKHGVVYDIHLYGMTKGDWESRGTGIAF